MWTDPLHQRGIRKLRLRRGSSITRAEKKAEMVEEPLSEITAQEIQALQGTRLDEKPPWMSYAAELDEKLSPQLEAEIAELSSREHAKTSSQTQEELHRQREINDGIAKDYQFLTPEEYAHVEPRIGRVMYRSQFITMLRDECKVQCWYRDHPHADKLTLAYLAKDKTIQVACWVQNGAMPEFSIVRFDEHGVPLNEQRRGWRTCLLQMVLKGIVSEDTVRQVFGEATGPAAGRYNSTLHEWRNRHMQLTEE